MITEKPEYDEVTQAFLNSLEPSDEALEAFERASQPNASLEEKLAAQKAIRPDLPHEIVASVLLNLIEDTEIIKDEEDQSLVRVWLIAKLGDLDPRYHVVSHLLFQAEVDSIKAKREAAYVTINSL